MIYMARRCFRKTKSVRWNTLVRVKQPRNTPDHFIHLPFYIKPLTLTIFHSISLCLFIILSGLGYQRCLIYRVGSDFDKETVKISGVKIGLRFKNLYYNIEKKS